MAHFSRNAIYYWLVVELTYPSEKYERQLLLLFPIEWKNNPFMFQTTNQMWFEP
jgi:hypothetical protein